MADRPGDWNQNVIDEFRANDGTVTTAGFGRALVLLHHVGARSGQERVTPVMAIRQDTDTWLVAASKAGAPENPAWFHNLRAHPDVSIEVPGEGTVLVRARVVSGDERDAALGAFHGDQPGVSAVRGAHQPHHPRDRAAPSGAVSSARGGRPGIEALAEPALGVEPGEQRVADGGQLPELGAGERVEHGAAHRLDVTGGGGDDGIPAGPGEQGVGGAAVLGAGEALHQVTGLEARDHVREPGKGGVRALGEGRHPQPALGRLGEHREHEVLEVGQARLGAQLRVEHPGEQLDDGDEPQPRRPFVVVQPLRVAMSAF